MSDHMRTYRKHWKHIVETDGKLDLDKVARELHDYHFILEEVPKVYDHVTGGLLSKPNYHASSVIGKADDHLSEMVDEAVKEAREEWEADGGTPSSARTCSTCRFGHPPDAVAQRIHKIGPYALVCSFLGGPVEWLTLDKGERWGCTDFQAKPSGDTPEPQE